MFFNYNNTSTSFLTNPLFSCVWEHANGIKQGTRNMNKEQNNKENIRNKTQGEKLTMWTIKKGNNVVMPYILTL